MTTSKLTPSEAKAIIDEIQQRLAKIETMRQTLASGRVVASKPDNRKGSGKTTCS